MTTRLLLLADTHIPARAKRLPDAVLRAVEQADLVVHAGDWVDLATLDLLETRARTLRGVYGNNDGPELRHRLPEIARFPVEGLEAAVIHETGGTRAREQRMDAAFPGVDLLIFGHSHIPWDTVSPAGMRLLNPGSPTDRRRQPVCTMMTVVVDGRHVEATLVPVQRE
ncbi:MAG TPA: metallophosphoesterase [Microbacterium sp.]|nr:metallophosphoesterase [Microbacterium sp.]